MTKFSFKAVSTNWLFLFLFPLLLFWLILFAGIPYSFSQYFHGYSLPLLFVVVILYYGSFSLSGKNGTLLPLGLTMILVSLSLSYIWSSGFSDNGIIGGLVPYKDGRNYYFGASLILNGLPMVKAGQATERPLFPSFMTTLLFFTGQNLKITLAIIVQLVGLGIYLSSRQIRNSFGPLAASVFAAFLYFYIQPFFGYSMSELLGFLAGCLGFTMICLASSQRRWIDLILGVVVLLVGVSARAGAFFIFPLIALWMGWIFRDDKRYSLKAAVYALVLIVFLYFLVNSVYARLVGIPPGNSFGNFSYAIYGQIRGGTGWHSAIEEVGTRDPNVVYRAAFAYFIKHPTDILIGFARSYRDLLQFGESSIFPFPNWSGWHYVPNLILWLASIVLMLKGIARSVKGIHSNLESLLLAGFAGVFLSIPFLPPVDGGSRFHAATVPFFFAPLAMGIRAFSRSGQGETVEQPLLTESIIPMQYLSTALLVLVMVVPVMIFRWSEKPAFSTASLECSVNQKPFVIETHPMSSIDLILDPSSQCGDGSRICMDDFQKNNLELKIDDFYQWMLSAAKEDNSNTRLFAALNLMDNKFYYFYIPLRDFPILDSHEQIAGCADRIETKNQIIFKVESVLPK